MARVTAALETSAALRPNVTSTTEKRYAWWVAAVALVAAVTMVLVVFRRQGLVANAGDPYDYGKIAHGFLEHGFDKVTRRAASLYPSFLSLIYWVGGGDLTIQLIQCALHVATCLLVFTLGRQMFNARTGLLAGLACAVHPMLLRYIPDLHMETWLTFWFMLTVWRAVCFDARRTVANGVVLAAVGVVATLSKGVALPVAVAYGAVWLVRALRGGKAGRRALPAIVAFAVTTAVLIAPWSFRNYEVSGRFVLLTPGTPDAFLRGYIFTRLEFATLQKPPYTYAEQECNALFRRIASEAGTTWEKDELADDDNNRRYMKRMIVEHPFDTVRKFVVGMFTFWYEMTSRVNSLIPGVLALVSWVFAIVGMKRSRREGRPFWLLLLPIVVSNVFVAALIPLGRYSVPVLPCLAILAAFGVDTLLERRKRSAAVSSTA